MKAETDLSKAASEVQQLKVQAAQDVQAALARLADAKKWAADYEQEVVPNLQKARLEVEKLFANNDPSVDLTRLLLVTRAYLKANETLVDAHYEVSQAETDLALAVAEPVLAMGPPIQPPQPASLPAMIEHIPSLEPTSLPAPTEPVPSPEPASLPATPSSNSPVVPVRAQLGLPVPLRDAGKN